MFGYVRISKPRLTCGDFERYRGVYCSLCRALGRRYGPLARLTLNYDMTFYAMLSLSGEETQFRRGRCPFNPLKKCRYCQRDLSLAADVSILMAYYKWRDKLEDGGFFERLRWLAPGLFFLWAGRRAARNNPAAARIIRTAVAAQRLVERENKGEIDLFAHPSAHALAALCGLIDEKYEQLGYLLGRWVYLADAADDMDEDKKRGRFNAFASAGGEPVQALRQTAAEIERIAKTLECNDFGPVIENILTLGLEEAEANIFTKARRRK